jgi:hypothetical protein
MAKRDDLTTTPVAPVPPGVEVIPPEAGAGMVPAGVATGPIPANTTAVAGSMSGEPAPGPVPPADAPAGPASRPTEMLIPTRPVRPADRRLRDELARPATATAEDEQRLTDRLYGIGVDALRDITGAAREVMEEYMLAVGPLIARQSLLLTSDDAATRGRAQRHLQHLRTQALAQAGYVGIGLQQRQEERFFATLDTLIHVGRHLTLGA